MTILFLLLFVFQSPFAGAQARNVQDAAYYDSLLRSGDSCNLRSYRRLTDIYRKEKKQVELKETLDRLMSCPLKHYEQRGYYLELADIYFNEGEFRKTLDLIALFDSTKDKVMRPHNPYQYVFNFTFSVKRSKCYEGLNLPDSALFVLSPFMFYKHSYFEGFYDSTSYQNVVNNYLRLLLSKHSQEQIKAALQQAELSFYYTDVAEHKVDQFGPFSNQKIDCGFRFFNYSIVYLKTQTVGRPGGIAYINHSKKFQYQYFKETPLYRIIKGW